MYATPLPVPSEMLLINGSLPSPQQHEPASPAEVFTLACDQSTIELLVGRLRGRWSVQLRFTRLWNVHFHRSFQCAVTKSMFFSSYLSGVPNMENYGIPMLLTASLILIASPTLCSLTIVESTVVVVRSESSVIGSCGSEWPWMWAPLPCA